MRRLLSILLLVIPATLHAQETAYGQYMFQSLYFNPAFAGNAQKIQVQAIARQQWTGIKGAPLHFSSSIDANLGRSNSAVGLETHYLLQGDFRTTKLFGNYAYRINFTNSVLSMGLGLGYGNSNIDFSKFENDPVQNVYQASKAFYDAKAGIRLSNEKFYLSFSAINLLEQEEISNGIRTYVASAGWQIEISESTILFPSVLIAYEPINGSTFLANTNIKIANLLWFGLGFRQALATESSAEEGLTQRNALALLMFDINNQIRFGYQYEQPIASVAGLGLQSHEVSLCIRMQQKKYPRISNPRYL